MIPKEWAPLVKPAAEMAAKEPALLEGEQGVPADATRRPALVGSANSIVAAMAMREALAGSALTPDAARERISKEAGSGRATLVYAVLAGGKANNQGQALAAELSRVLDDAKSADDIRPIVVGAFAAALFNPAEQQVTTRSRSTLAKAKERATRLGIAQQKEPGMYLIFEKMNVR
jgi:hypothetical protein